MVDKDNNFNSNIFILLSYLACIDGELHSSELDYLKEWIDFLYHCGGFSIN